MNDALIVELERDPIGAALLARPWHEVEALRLSTRDAARLRRHLWHVRTVREALALRLPSAVAELVERVVRDAYEARAAAHERAARSPDGGLSAGIDREALRRWAADNAVADLIELPIGELVDPVALYRLGAWRHDLRVADVICAKPGPRPRWDAPSAALQQEVVALLVDLAERSRAWLAHEVEAGAWREVPPEPPVARELWERLRELRRAARAEVPPRGWHGEITLEVELDPLAIAARGPMFRPGEARIVLEPTIALPRLQPAAARLAFADRVLDFLTSPDDADARADLVHLLAVPRWRRDLEALARVAGRPPTHPEEDKNLLCWRLVDDRGYVAVEPTRAARSKRGTLQTRASTVDEVADLLVDPIDRRVAALVAAGDGPSRLEAIELLVGHPRVLAPGRGQGKLLPVRRGRLALTLRDEDGVVSVALALDGEPLAPDEIERALAHDAGATRIVFRRPAAVVVAEAERSALARIAPWLTRDARVPPEGHDALLDVVAAISALPVDVPPSLRGERLEGDPRPLLLLAWEDPPALSVTARVRPVPELAPELPGAGSALRFVRRGGRRWCVERDLDAEGARLREALAPLGLPERAAQGPFAWRLADRGEALAVVERLQEHLARFQVEWSGEVPRVRPPVTAGALRLTVSQDRDWFGIAGVARLESGSVDLGALLRTLDEGHDYVQVGPSTFARVDEALKADLALLARPGAELSSLLAPAVRALEQAGAEVEAPVAWRDLLGRLEEARQLEAPVPSGLRAELRDYQVTGFRWLAALAHWAPGACLADDMGLGKTVQAIALLLHRAALGPALVVAPASVLFNWERELARFAPDLRVRVHHGSERSLAPPEAGSVVLTSYGVLLRDAEALGEVRFATAVLDEAQAIKNPATLRSAAAFRLQADFRLALSGTPVENRVAELWSLFRFVAPGLLGGEAAFRARFVEPIEGRRDPRRRALLAATIRPFVLRRTKEQVERELPPLTESVLRVSLSREERTLYEAARVRAVARVAGAPARERRLRVLQELLTLRQLACHPRLVDPGAPVASSKLRHLRRLVADLRANGHRALVFSQFVRHLALVREALDADGVRYRYLDGAMPLAARRAEVDAFQSGDGDVFLISREAGGVGLNLTAADYVIHLDPGWNPAKEDQATDRAHRIGQDRPVTVYRLVTEATIEERILALHAEKRELADALLEGTDGGARATTAELLALLAEDLSPAPPSAWSGPPGEA